MIIMNHNVPIAILTCRNETSNYLQHLKVLSLICWISCLLYHKPSGLRQTSLTFSNISLSTITKRVNTVFSPLPFETPVSCQGNDQFSIVESKIQLSSISHCFLHRPERSGNWYDQITIGQTFRDCGSHWNALAVSSSLFFEFFQWKYVIFKISMPNFRSSFLSMILPPMEFA